MGVRDEKHAPTLVGVRTPTSGEFRLADVRVPSAAAWLSSIPITPDRVHTVRERQAREEREARQRGKRGSEGSEGQTAHTDVGQGAQSKTATMVLLQGAGLASPPPPQARTATVPSPLSFLLRPLHCIMILDRDSPDSGSYQRASCWQGVGGGPNDLHGQYTCETVRAVSPMSVAAEADSDAQHGGLDAQQARLRGMRQAHQHLDQTPLPNTFTKHFSADTHPHLAVVDSANLVYFRRHPHRAGLIAVSTQAFIALHSHLRFGRDSISRQAAIDVYEQYRADAHHQRFIQRTVSLVHVRATEVPFTTPQVDASRAWTYSLTRAAPGRCTL